VGRVLTIRDVSVCIAVAIDLTVAPM